MRKINNRYYYVNASFLAVLKLLSLLGITTSAIVNAYTDSVSAVSQTKTITANAFVRVSGFCSMTATVQPGEQHSVTLIGGQYKADIGKTTIQTFCNDPNGYAIYAIGYTGEDAGVAAGTNTVLHSNALGSTYDIVTGIATSGDTSNWAMKVSSVSGTYAPTIESDAEGSFSNYHTVPQSYAKVAAFSSNTDATIGSSLTTTYSAYIGHTQPAGAYEGQVKYVLLHPMTETPHHYYMQDVESWGSLIAIGEEVTAYDIRDEKSYTVRRMCMNSGTGSTWQEKEANCKVANSMLWMTQNLDLDLNKDIELTSEDTDLNVIDDEAYNTGYTQDSRGIIHWLPANTTITRINASNGDFVTNFDYNINVASSADPDAGNPDNSWYITGEAYNSSLCYKGSYAQTCNYLNSSNTVAPTYFSHTPFTGNGNHGKIGNYYNWSAAIASDNSSSFNTSTYDDVTNNPQNSICPKGWRLPTASSVGTNNEFARLNKVYNNSSDKSGVGLIDSPVYMVRAGYIFYSGSSYYAGYSGLYWSSTVYNASHAYNLIFRSDYVNHVSTGYDKSNMKSVRCISDY